MNKLSKIITLLIFVGFSSFAQKAELQSAINYVNWNDLEKAKTSIDNCTANESTMSMAKTWYWSGFIYQAIADSKDEKLTALKPGALEQALKSYKKALELDAKSNDYKQDITEKMRNIAYNYMEQGISNFQEKRFEEALKNFEIGIAVKRDYFNQTDTNGINNCALSAYKSGQYTKAALYYNQLLSLNAGDAKTYMALSSSFLIKMTPHQH